MIVGLESEKSVVGYLTDENGEPTGGTAHLKQHPENLYLTVIWDDAYHAGPASWFEFKVEPSGGGWFTPVESEPKVPSVLYMTDGSKSYALIGCNVANGPNKTIENFDGMTGKGSVTLSVIYAVESSVPCSFETINALSSSIDQLQEWMGDLHRKEVRYLKKNESGMVQGAGFGVEVKGEPEPIIIGDVDGSHLSVRKSFGRWKPQRGDVVIREATHFVTAKSDHAKWNSHLSLHRDFKDLLSLLCLSDVGFTDHRAQSWETPESTDVSQETWHGVATSTTGITTYRVPEKELKFLCNFSHLGATGVSNWMRLRRCHERSLEPFYTAIKSPNLEVEVKCVLMGITFELLYQELYNNGKRVKEPKRFGGPNFEQKLRNIGKLLPINTDFDYAIWASSMANSYNKTKHFGEKRPDVITVTEDMEKSMQVLRLFFAGEMSVPNGHMSDFFKKNPMCGTYTLEAEV